MKHQLLRIISCIALTSALASAVAMATSIYVYTDASNPWSINGNNIAYTLNLALDPGNKTGSATFLIDTSKETLPPSYYAVEFDFKLVSGNSTPDLSNLVVPTGTGSWTILDSSNAEAKILKNGKGFKALSGSAAGFAVTSILYEGSTPPALPDYTQGILANGNPGTSQFDFDFNLGTDVFRTDGIVPYQAIFFEVDGSSTKFAGQLSVTLDDGVDAPEPGSLILLGTGLLGIGACLWRRKK